MMSFREISQEDELDLGGGELRLVSKGSVIGCPEFKSPKLGSSWCLRPRDLESRTCGQQSVKPR